MKASLSKLLESLTPEEQSEVETFAGYLLARREVCKAEKTEDSSQGKSTHSLLEIRGLGKELWKGIDAQEYVDRERGSWTG